MVHIISYLQRENKMIKLELEKTIKVAAYTVDAIPVCAINFNLGEVCRFLTTIHFGCTDICSANNEILIRNRSGEGFLIPSDTCPIWSGE